MKKRALSMVLAIIMVVILLPVNAFAVGTTTEIYVDTSNIGDLKAGDSVSIPVAIRNNPGIMGAYLEFDIPDALTYVSYENVSGADSITWTAPNMIQWDYDNNYSELYSEDGVLFVLNFTVKENAEAGTYSLGVGLLEDTAENVHNGSDTVTATFTPGTITIAAPETGATFTNGTQSFTYEQIKAEGSDYVLTNPDDYYFAGWFMGLESVTSGIAKVDGYYVLDGDSVVSGTVFNGVIECSPKYDAEPESGKYYALWVNDNSGSDLAYLLSTTASATTFHKDAATNATAFLKNTLIAVGTDGFVKMLHNMTVDKIDANDGTNYHAIHLDINGNTLTATSTSGIKLRMSENVVRSSYRKGSITAGDSTVVTLAKKASTASLYDLRITAIDDNACVKIENDCRLEALVRCELKSESFAALYVYGKPSTVQVVELIDSCKIQTSGREAINNRYASCSIEMIVNSEISSDATDAPVIKNAGTITFGAGNTVTGVNQLINGGNVNFTVAGGTYRVDPASTLPMLDEACTVTTPAGYAVKEVNKELVFKAAFAVTYKDSTGTETLLVEKFIVGEQQIGQYVPQYTVSGINTYRHLGWSATVGGAAITDFSGYTADITLYDVCEPVELDTAVEVSDGTTTYKYASWDLAAGDFKNTGFDTAGKTVTFKLFADQTASKGFTIKNASLILDLNGTALTVRGATSFIIDQSTSAGRTVCWKSSAHGGEIIMDSDITLYMVNPVSASAPNFTAENIKITSTTGILYVAVVVNVLSEPMGNVTYTFKNTEIALDSGNTMARVLSAAVPLAETSSLKVVIENSIMTTTLIQPLFDGSNGFTLSLDVKSKFSMANGLNPISSAFTIVPKTGYTYCDLDGDGPETWYGMKLNTYSADVTTLGQSASVHDTVDVYVGVNHGGSVTAFHAAEVVLTFPTAHLQLVTDNLDVLKAAGTLDYKLVVGSDGLTTLTIEQFANAKVFATDNYTLTFKALAEGNATVTLVSAKFAHKDTVINSDLQDAVILNNAVTLELIRTEVTVTIPGDQEFTGATVATKGESYTFTVDKNPNYNYTITVTVGGNTVQPTVSGNNYTIANVTGDIVITLTKTAKTFTVTWDDASNHVTTKPTEATYGQSFTFVLPADQTATGLNSGYYFLASAVYTGTSTPVTISKNGTTCTIDGSLLTANITITVTKVTVDAPQTIITIIGSDEIYHGDEQKTTINVDKNSTVTLELRKAAGYTYIVKVDGVAATLDSNGNFTVSVGTSGITVTVEKKLGGTVEISQYLTLNGYTMFLVTYKDTSLTDANSPCYGENTMLWSDKYNAYSWLVIAETLSAEDALSAISVKAVSKQAVDYSMDINGTERIDAADAQFVYNMYTAEYNSFTNVAEAMFLAADQNGNSKIDVADATVITNAILNGTAQ